MIIEGAEGYERRPNHATRKMRLPVALLRSYTKPIISAVEGYYLGGGLELALFGDIIVASEAAQFRLPEGGVTGT